MKKKDKTVWDGMKRITEVEALTFARMDSDIRCHILGARNADLELDLLHRNFQAKKAEYENNKALSQQQLNLLRPQYVEFSRGLAEKYNVDQKRMVIDPDTRVIRDL
jgi:hypothetical protein